MSPVRGCIAFVFLAAASAMACDDEEGFPPAVPANDTSDVPPGAATGPATAGSPVAPPPGTPQPLGGAWTVAFPEEAERSGIASADVVLLVTVSPGGGVEDVAVVTDPGHGFGEAARDFARDQQFKPAVDASGAAIRATTRIRVRFRR